MWHTFETNEKNRLTYPRRVADIGTEGGASELEGDGCKQGQLTLSSFATVVFS